MEPINTPPGVTTVGAVEPPTPPAPAPPINQPTPPAAVPPIEIDEPVVEDYGELKDSNWVMILLGVVLTTGLLFLVDYARKRAFVQTQKEKDQDLLISRIQASVNDIQTKLPE